VQFAHGLESSPRGSKARILAEHFDALTPVMDTADFEACVAVHAAALRDFRPDVLVDDDHRLARSAAAGRLEEWVRGLAAWRPGPRGAAPLRTPSA
jgi:hypothetical protein